MPTTEAQRRAAKKWRDNNKEAHALAQKRWIENNPEHYNDISRNKSRIYYYKNREIVRAKQRAAYAEKSDSIFKLKLLEAERQKLQKDLEGIDSGTTTEEEPDDHEHLEEPIDLRGGGVEGGRSPLLYVHPLFK